MLFRNVIITGFVVFGLMALMPTAVHAEDKQDAPAASTDQPASTDDAADKNTDDAAKTGDAKSDEVKPEEAKPDSDKAGSDKAGGDKASGDKGADGGSKDDEAAIAAIKAAMVHGPHSVQLGEQATVDMPKGFVFLPKEQALQLMAAMGNNMDKDNFYGLFMPEDEAQTWFVAASFDDSGFIKDDDQSKINADEILSGMKKGVDEDNEDRKSKGVSQLEIVGWIEKPHYDAKAHHLVWSIEAKEFGGSEPPSADNSINYNTFALSRGGYISLNLVSKKSTIDSDKKAVATLLDDLKFNEGKKYENFDPKSDKVAEYGLMALIGGIAAHKLGLFAVIAAVAVKGAKVLVVAALAGVAAIKKFFKRRDPTV